MSDRSRSSLPAAMRARLHAQLATLERAGIPPRQALEALDLHGEAQQRVQRAKSFLAQGQSLAGAGRLSGLFTPMESAVIAAASQGSSPERAHQRLGEHAGQRAQQARQLRSRLMLPGLVALAALVILPVPAVVAGTLGAGAYLLRLVLTLAAVAGVIALGRELLRRQAMAEDWPGRAMLEQVTLSLPLVGPLLARAQAQRFIEHLGLLLDCGLPAVDAVRHAATTVRVQCIRANFEDSVPALAAGHSLHSVAGGWQYVVDPVLAGMIATGEGSGRVPELLSRYAANESDALDSDIDTLATWLPRVAYLLLAMLLAWQLIGSFAALVRRDLG